MSNVSGTGKEIKYNAELVRAQRINSCLNKAIRNRQKDWSPENDRKVKHWQKILFNFYGVNNDQLDSRENS